MVSCSELTDYARAVVTLRAHVRRQAVTPETQERALRALRFECGMLWSRLDT